LFFHFLLELSANYCSSLSNNVRYYRPNHRTTNNFLMSRKSNSAPDFRFLSMDIPTYHAMISIQANFHNEVLGKEIMGNLYSGTWYLGIDLGTGSCKTAVVDAKGAVLGFSAKNYKAQDVDEKWQEQDPDEILKGMVISVKNAIADAGVSPNDCGGLSLGGALHNIMALGADYRPLTGVFTWADTRCDKQVQNIKNSPQGAEIYKLTGCPAHTIYGLYKIIWLKETSPIIFNQATKFISAKEYIYYHLTGEFLVDFGLASGNSLINIHTLEYDPKILTLASITEDMLSKLAPPLTTHRGIKPTLAIQMGLSPDTLVILGTSDAANSSIGAGAIHQSQATLSVGTSGAYRVITATPALDAAERSWCYAIDNSHWLVGGAINNAGFSLAWWKDSINQLFPSDSQLSFDQILLKASEVEPGANNLICLPYFTGERSPHWNPKARGVLFGLGLQHDIRHISRAILEGVAFSFRNLDEILISIGYSISEVRASGGFINSQIWLQIMANVLGRQMNIPDWGETAARGAALWAMLATGIFNTIEEAAAVVKSNECINPEQATSNQYSHLYKLFQQLYPKLESSFDDINK
jgi:gluconokinase